MQVAWKWVKQRTLILCLSWLDSTDAIWGSSFSRVERKEPDKGRRRKWGVDSPPTLTNLFVTHQSNQSSWKTSLSLYLFIAHSFWTHSSVACAASLYWNCLYEGHWWPLYRVSMCPGLHGTIFHGPGVFANTALFHSENCSGLDDKFWVTLTLNQQFQWAVFNLYLTWPYLVFFAWWVDHALYCDLKFLFSDLCWVTFLILLISSQY